MKVIFLTSSAWLSRKDQCAGLIERISDSNTGTPEFIVLDAATVQRENGTSSARDSDRFVEIDFRAWVNETLTEGGVINIEAIRRATIQISCESCYVINAIGFDVGTIYRALGQLRIGFYTLAIWPKSLVLVGDDAQLHHLAPALAHTFYIQPEIVARMSLKRMVRQISHEARFVRLLGFRPGIFERKLFAPILGWRMSREVKKDEKVVQGWRWEEKPLHNLIDG